MSIFHVGWLHLGERFSCKRVTSIVETSRYLIKNQKETFTATPMSYVTRTDHIVRIHMGDTFC